MELVTVETLIQQALKRARSERERVVAKRDAFRTFASRVDDVPADSPRPHGGGGSPTAGETLSMGARATATGDDRCREVLNAFARTVCPHNTDDEDGDGDGSESVVETVAMELNDDIAAALAPSASTHPFRGVLKRAVLTEANARIREYAVLIDALERECEALSDANSDIKVVIEWLERVDETQLVALGFEDLRPRHETLVSHRERCERLAHDRQVSLDEKTTRGTTLGLTHRSLLASLYADFPVNYPVLATAVRQDSACADCQRAARDHLARRV